MTNVRADQAPARAAIGLATVCTLVATLGLEFVVAPGLARAAETADGASLPQDQHLLAPAPAPTSVPAVDSVADAPSPSRWARLPLWQKVLGVGASLVGLAAVGSGAYFLWQDGRAACSPPSGTCAYHHQTALAGWLLVAGGTAASLGGVTLVLLPPIGASSGRAVARLALSASF
ncbi:MAG TPA: hypothetical protein VJ860_14040 [Polyangia bacterium]|jgi:hypothetical protein|nr:hypothetical protein [Polyangia bacterium]